MNVVVSRMEYGVREEIISDEILVAIGEDKIYEVVCDEMVKADFERESIRTIVYKILDRLGVSATNSALYEIERLCDKIAARTGYGSEEDQEALDSFRDHENEMAMQEMFNDITLVYLSQRSEAGIEPNLDELVDVVERYFESMEYELTTDNIRYIKACAREAIITKSYELTVGSDELENTIRSIIMTKEAE